MSPNAAFSQDLKSAIIEMLKKFKETMFKELKESMITMIPQIENINEEMEIIKKKKRTK